MSAVRPGILKPKPCIKGFYSDVMVRTPETVRFSKIQLCPKPP